MSTPASDLRAQTWVDIDLRALVANARAFQAMTGTPLLPVVKANAYGLGVVEVVRALEALPPWGYAVGTVEEGAELRGLGIKHPILVLTPLTPFRVEAHLHEALRPTIGDLETLSAWLDAGTSPFHIEFDTGMGRSGFLWHDRQLLDQLGDLVGAAPNWEGAFCQFHSADSDDPATREQWQRLHDCLAAVGRRPAIVHAANSAAGARGLAPGADLVRPGVFLYGVPVGGTPPRPVVSFRTQVVALRRLARGDPVSYGATWTAPSATTIATLAAGYADGVPLELGNGGLVQIEEALYPIVGRVTMDMTMVDIGDARVTLGDTATFFGGQITIEAQARAAGTIPYLLLTGLGDRVERRYLPV